MSSHPFVHLRVRSEYSILAGVPAISELLTAAIGHGYETLALTDYGVMFGAIEFQEQCKKRKVKPIHGIELQLERERGDGKASVLVFPVNQTGYQNLCRLIAKHFQSPQSYPPTIVHRNDLFAIANDIIVLSGFSESEIAHHLMRHDEAGAERLVCEWKEAFGDRFYLELQDVRAESSEELITGFERLAQRCSVPVTISNAVKYVGRDDAITFDLLQAIGERMLLSQFQEIHGTECGEAYLKSPDEMYERFRGRETALERTVEIAERIEFKVPTGQVQIPRFPIPDDAGTNDIDEYFTKLAWEGLRSRIPEINNTYRERLEYELDIVKRTHFSGYYLIVADFITEARKRGVPVGPGRGSVAGSLAAYAFHITHLDPLEHDLIFERFLNPERISAPDMDIDFADDQRNIVIDYVRERYGAGAVSQIATFGSLKAKGAIRDTGRVLGINLADVERLANAFGRIKPPPDTDYFSIADAIKFDADFRKIVESNSVYTQLIEYAGKLENKLRNVGTHAAGVVIAPGDLSEYLPLYRISGGELISQYDKDVIEKAGFLKMDMLGLTMLSTVRETVGYVERNPKYASYLNTDGKFEIDAIPLEDEKTLELFGKGITVGVFQFESSGMQRSLIQLKPSRLGDLIAMNALYRPGPMQRIPDFIACKQGKQKIKYIHKSLEPILKDTYGVIVYQEQVMLIAREVGGFSMSKADTLRKAMGKKDAHLLETLHPEFINGALEKGLSKKQADELYDQILKFSNYGFNKSHSAGYSYLAYQTGYLKAHFPSEFLAASMTANMGKPDRVLKLMDEARRMNIQILPPDVNHSMLSFEPVPEGIRFGLAAIKNVGEGAVKEILRQRNEGGVFTSLHEFAKRIDTHVCNRRVLEALVNSGACDAFGERGQLFSSIPDAIEFASIHSKYSSSDASLFGESGTSTIAVPMLRASPPMPKREKLLLEKSLIGYYISGHPLDEYSSEIAELHTVSLGEAEEWTEQPRTVRIACVLSSIQRKTTKDGKQWAIGKIEDFTGSCEIMVYNDALSRYQSILESQALLLIEGQAARRDEEEAPRITLRSAVPMDQALNLHANAVILRLTPDKWNEAWLERFVRILEEYPGNTDLQIILDRGDGKPLHTRPNTKRLNLNRDSLRLLRKAVGEEYVQIIQNRSAV
ncbi:MAG: DNA polymerase III subunit alpha [bacterium]|nr:DNA polymerase III subunit alpha [bacterium]